MTNNDIQEFYTVLSATIMLIKPEFIPNKQYMDFYFLTLEEFSISDVKIALTKHIKNPTSGMFIPKPADLIKYLRPDVGNVAECQWSIVMNAVSFAGRYGNLYFEDKTTNTIVREIGFINLCNMTETQEPFERRRFIESYGRYHDYAPTYEAGITYGVFHRENTNNSESEEITFVKRDGSRVKTNTSDICSLLNDDKRAEALKLTFENKNNIIKKVSYIFSRG